MYCGNYASWDHYPKNLRLAEVMQPMHVIIEFFSSDCIVGHQRRLKEWRNFVTDEENYFLNSHGPGVLIFTCEQNIRLLEAMYLLLLQYQDGNQPGNGVTEEQLSHEKDHWEYFPDNLSIDHLRNPFSVTRDVYEKISPQQYRDYLKDWLYVALTIHNSADYLQADEIILVYENLLLLYSAAWLIYRRDQNTAFLKKNPGHLNTEVDNDAQPGQTTTGALGTEVQPLVRVLTPADQLGLSEITKLILKSEPLVKAVFHLGTLHEPFTYFLYILIDDKRHFPNYDLNEKLEALCKTLVPVFTMVDKVGLTQKEDVQDRQFFEYVKATGSLVYKCNGYILPGLENESAKDVTEKKAWWEWWQSQSQDFHICAKYMADEQNLQMSLYFLHQALELSLLGLLQVKTGYYTTIPNLKRLINMTLLFTSKIFLSFESLKTKQADLHHLLWNVHPVESRRQLTLTELQIEGLHNFVFEVFDIIQALVKEDEILSSG